MLYVLYFWGEWLEAATEPEGAQHSRPLAVWDGTDEAGRKAGTGIYFVRLETESSRVVRKILLLH